MTVDDYTKREIPSMLTFEIILITFESIPLPKIIDQDSLWELRN